MYVTTLVYIACVSSCIHFLNSWESNRQRCDVAEPTPTYWAVTLFPSTTMPPLIRLTAHNMMSKPPPPEAEPSPASPGSWTKELCSVLCMSSAKDYSSSGPNKHNFFFIITRLAKSEFPDEYNYDLFPIIGTPVLRLANSLSSVTSHHQYWLDSVPEVCQVKSWLQWRTIPNNYLLMFDCWLVSHQWYHAYTNDFYKPSDNSSLSHKVLGYYSGTPK